MQVHGSTMEGLFSDIFNEFPVLLVLVPRFVKKRRCLTGVVADRTIVLL